MGWPAYASPHSPAVRFIGRGFHGVEQSGVTFLQFNPIMLSLERKPFNVRVWGKERMWIKGNRTDGAELGIFQIHDV